jgi:hypothetical protein
MRRAAPIITRHAVDRFVERHAPHLTAGEAFRHLLQELPNAAHLKAKTLLGHHQWQIRDPDCVLVLRENCGRMICVTVLPEPESQDPSVAEARTLKRRGRRHW